MPEWIYSLLPLLGLVVFVVTGAWRWLPTWMAFSPPNIKLSEFRSILPPEERITINRNSPKKYAGADMSVQLKGQNALVIYHRTDHDHTIVETADISAVSKAGVIVTFKDGEVVTFQKIGGRLIHNPRLSPEEQCSVTDLLRRVRTALKL